MAKIDVLEHTDLIHLRKQRLFPVLEADWLRLKQMCQQIVPQPEAFRLFASVLLGVAGSTLLSLIGLSTSWVESWVRPTLLAVLACAVILGVALIFLDRALRNANVFTRKELLDEMARIEGMYESRDANSGAQDTNSLANKLAAERKAIYHVE